MRPRLSVVEKKIIDWMQVIDAGANEVQTSGRRKLQSLGKDWVSMSWIRIEIARAHHEIITIREFQKLLLHLT